MFSNLLNCAYIFLFKCLCPNKMPCKCAVPAVIAPEIRAWGPVFWELLHGLSVSAGKLTDKLVQGDEVRAWIQLIDNLKNVLPCEECMAHYKRWLAGHDLKQLLTMPYQEFGPWVRNYFFRLHNEINAENTKPQFLEGDLISTYGGVQIKVKRVQLDLVIKQYILARGIALLQWTKWQAYVRTLEGLYGI